MSTDILIATLVSLVGFYVIWKNLKSMVRIKMNESTEKDYTIPYHAFKALSIVLSLMIIGISYNRTSADGLTATVLILLFLSVVLCNILASLYKESE